MFIYSVELKTSHDKSTQSCTKYVYSTDKISLRSSYKGYLLVFKDELRSWIQGNVTNCPNQLFIFDEVDKMPDGLLDVLSPFIDNHENLGGVDYRRATFIFLRLVTCYHGNMHVLCGC